MQQEQSFAHQKMEAVNQLAQQALAYMEQKYHKPFVIASLTEGNLLASEQKFRMYAQGDDPETDMAVVKSYNYGEAFEDNYFGIQVRAEYLQEVRQALALVYEQFKVFSTGFMEDSFSPQLDVSKTYQDAKAAGEFMTSVLFIYTQDQQQKVEDSKKTLDEAFKQAGIIALVKVIGLRPPHMDQVDDSNFHQLTPYIRDVDQEVCTAMLDLYIGPQTPPSGEKEGR